LSKKGKLLLVLILAILIVLSVAFGFIAAKKLNNANKSDTGVKSSKHVNTPESQGNGQSSVNQQDSDDSIICPECNGAGTITCPTCQGRGLYYICNACGAKTYTYLNICPGCGVRNSLVHHSCPTTVTCSRCGGTGRISG
jgi:RecJ-like exonuclease